MKRRPEAGAAFCCAEAQGTRKAGFSYMAVGTFKWFNEESGFGLISPVDGGKNLFVYSTDIASGSILEALKKGDQVTYEVYQGRNGMRATSVSRRRRYSWRDDCRERLEGKEARHEYYAGL